MQIYKGPNLAPPQHIIFSRAISLIVILIAELVSLERCTSTQTRVARGRHNFVVALFIRMVKPMRPPANGFVAGMRKVYNPLGFSKGYNFVLCTFNSYSNNGEVV